MSSKVEIKFVHLHETFSTKSFSIRHMRNYMLNENGGSVPSPNGGHTVMADPDGDIYVAKCNFKFDKFSRKLGLKEVIKKYIHRNFIGYTMVCMTKNGLNRFVVHLEPTLPF